MLTDKAIIQAKPKAKRYRLADQTGNNLSLEVLPNGGKHWRFRYRINGKAKMVSLGTYPSVKLAEARNRAVSGTVLNGGVHDACMTTQESGCHFGYEFFSGIYRIPKEMLVNDSFTVQPGFMPGGVGQFVKEGGIVFFGPLIPEKVRNPNTVTRRGVASPGSSDFHGRPIRHG